MKLYRFKIYEIIAFDASDDGLLFHLISSLNESKMVQMQLIRVQLLRAQNNCVIEPTSVHRVASHLGLFG